MEAQRYYEAVLGVPPGADDETVKRAFRERAKKTHPDVPGGNANEFKRVREAYKALSDPKRSRALGRANASSPVPRKTPEPQEPRGATTVFRVGASPFPLPRAPFPFVRAFHFPR